jgi:hypothetical protein
MRRIPSAAERARWLAEVAQALDQAQAVVERMSGGGADGREHSELVHRIEAARQLTRSLRLSSERRTAEPFHPQ